MLEYFAAAKAFVETIATIREKLLPSKTLNRRNFEEVYTPIFLAAEPLVADVIRILREALNEVSTFASAETDGIALKVETLAASLWIDRDKHVTARAKLRAELEALINYLSPSEGEPARSTMEVKAHNYLDSLRELFGFRTWKFLFMSKAGSPFGRTIELVETLRGGADAKDVALQLTELIHHLELYWNVSAKSYYELRDEVRPL